MPLFRVLAVFAFAWLVAKAFGSALSLLAPRRRRRVREPRPPRSRGTRPQPEQREDAVPGVSTKDVIDVPYEEVP